MKMKWVLLLIIISVSGNKTEAQTIDWKPLESFMHLDTVGYPFFESPSTRHVERGVPFSKNYWGDLPIYTYKDIGERVKLKEIKFVSDFERRFCPTNGKYHLVVTSFINPDSQRGLLITFDTLGHVIDYLESTIYFPGCYIKHWGIDSSMQVITYHLKMDTPEPIVYFGDYSEVSGQRVDTYYQLDSLGKFHFVKEILYKPQKYTKEFLNDQSRSVWDGDETSNVI